MSRSGSYFAVLAGLALALALVLIAYMPSAAQAEKGAAWKVNGTGITATLKPSFGSEVENLSIAILFKIFFIKVKILCKFFETTNTLSSEGGVNEGKIKLAGCAVFLNEETKASTPCLPKTAGVSDIIESNTTVGLLVLAGGVGEMLIRAAAGIEKPLMVIESTEECAVGQKINITGELLLKEGSGKITEELVTHLIEADNVNGTLKASGQAATIDGSINFSLKGAHSGLKWSGSPA